MSENLKNENVAERTIKATVHQIDDINIIEITHVELSAIIGNSFTKSLFSVLTGISVSAFISFLITINTVTIADPRINAIFIAVILVFGLSTLICGLFWIKSEIKAYFLSKKYTLK